MADFEYSKEYDDLQKTVINQKNTKCLVLAPPGCGKTDILAERIAKALHDGQDPKEMVCLTFTNRAARGMYERIEKRVGIKPSDIFVGNLHKFSSEFLFGEHIVDAGSNILDEFDTQDVLSQFLTDEELEELLDVKFDDYGNCTPAWYIIHEIFLLKDKWPTPNNVRQSIKGNRLKFLFNDCRLSLARLSTFIFQVLNNHPQDVLLAPEFLAIDHRLLNAVLSAYVHHDDVNFDFSDLFSDYPLIEKVIDYDNYKKDNNLLVFDDLLVFAYDTYLKDKDNRYPHFSWLQIDEVQDLNPLQLALVDVIQKKNDDNTVIYLGDEQQAIFSFMGAKLDSLKSIAQKCNEKIIHLKKNYRSPEYLVNLYNRYAEKILDIDPELLPSADNKEEAGENAMIAFGFLSSAENIQIARRTIPFMLKNCHEDDKERKRKAIEKNEDPDCVKPSRVAVLVPTNKLADDISSELKSQKIPHYKISGTDIFRRNETKTVFSHFSVLSNNCNFLDWARILWQTYTFDTFYEAREAMHVLRKIGIMPSDLMLYDQSTELLEFINTYENETFIVFDTETTGLDIPNDDIVEISAFKVKNGEIIEGSEIDIFLESDKEIPEKLGNDDNPLIEEYEKQRKAGKLVPRKDGLTEFLNYIDGYTIVGHNVNYDYNILDANLKRDCGVKDFKKRFTKYFDSLNLARLTEPRLKKYKLKALLEQLGLEGENSHLASDDIIATKSVLDYCYQEALELRNDHIEFLNSPSYQWIRTHLNDHYRDLYFHSRERFYEVDSHFENADYCTALADEMCYAFNTLFTIKNEKENDFLRIWQFIDRDVVLTEWGNTIQQQLSHCLYDLNTYKEADLCESSAVSEKVFVSTVHKAKGLEFENVIVTTVIEGYYPFANSNTDEKKKEDARKLYVALSRAKKRICLTYSRYNLWDRAQSLSPFISNEDIGPFFKFYQEKKQS